jgi:hypothetical protein
MINAALSTGKKKIALVFTNIMPLPEGLAKNYPDSGA